MATAEEAAKCECSSKLKWCFHPSAPSTPNVRADVSSYYYHLRNKSRCHKIRHNDIAHEVARRFGHAMRTTCKPANQTRERVKTRNGQKEERREGKGTRRRNTKGKIQIAKEERERPMNYTIERRKTKTKEKTQKTTKLTRRV